MYTGGWTVSENITIIVTKLDKSIYDHYCKRICIATNNMG